MNPELESDVRKNIDLVTVSFLKFLDECDGLVPWFSKVKRVMQVSFDDVVSAVIAVIAGVVVPVVVAVFAIGVDVSVHAFFIGEYFDSVIFILIIIKVADQGCNISIF